MQFQQFVGNYFFLTRLISQVEVLDHESGWHVTDISGRIRVSPYWSSATSGLTIAQEDIGLNAYYWEGNVYHFHQFLNN